RQGISAPRPDPTRATLAENVEGFASAVTGGEGLYAFKPVNPAASPASAPGWWRPPHIHFDVLSDYSRLCTQMYFPGEKLNDEDFLIARHRKLGDGELIVAKPGPLPAGARPDALSPTLSFIPNPGPNNRKKP